MNRNLIETMMFLQWQQCPPINHCTGPGEVLHECSVGQECLVWVVCAELVITFSDKAAFSFFFLFFLSLL